MTIPDYQPALSARFLRRSFAFACVASLLLGSSANAGTILQFAQTSALDTVTATENAGNTATTLSGSISVIASNFAGVPQFPGIPLFETFVGVTSTGAATTSGGIISQTYAGTVEFTSLPNGAGTNFLTATFTTAMFSGSGNSASLNATAPALTFTSALGIFDGATGMSLSFSGIAPGPLSINGSSIASFGAQNTGTFSATIVPEPGTLCLASIAVAIGTLAYGRKRMKID